jgi:HK97 family phage prohead protease
MKREYRASSEALEIRQELGEPLKIRGYAAVFNQLSQPIFGFRERILPGAFKKSLSNDVRALVSHDPALILGRTKSGTLKLREDEHGLHTEIAPPNTSLGHDTVESIKRGDLDQMSFGFQVVTDEWKHEDKQLIRELVEVELFDVSVVAFPAYTQTSVSVRSLWPDGMPEEIEKATAEPSVVPKESPQPSQPGAARKRLDDLEKEFGIKK